MPERSCRRTASAHAPITALIRLSAVPPCCIMALAPTVCRYRSLGRTPGCMSDTPDSLFDGDRFPGHESAPTRPDATQALSEIMIWIGWIFQIERMTHCNVAQPDIGRQLCYI